MEIRIDTPERVNLVRYGSIPIAFEVRSRLDLTSLLRPTSEWIEIPTEAYTKDYDAYDGGPTGWPDRFDVSHWALVIAFREGEPVGGAAVAWRTPGLDMLEGRDDLVVVWDIRVAPAYRGQGVGRLLFDTAVDWAQARGCTELKVETQDVNVAACRFYAAQGCHLASIDENAYGSLREAQVLWRRALESRSRSGM